MIEKQVISDVTISVSKKLLELSKQMPYEEVLIEHIAKQEYTRRFEAIKKCYGILEAKIKEFNKLDKPDVTTYIKGIGGEVVAQYSEERVKKLTAIQNEINGLEQALENALSKNDFNQLFNKVKEQGGTEN